MSLDPAALVQRYLDTVVTGSAEDVAALYADDATVEDPVGGGEVHIGRKAIAGFYGLTANADVATELLQLRVGGHEAAFVFAITVTMGDTKIRIEPIEVMTFNGVGEITSMKAYWGPSDMKQL
ncbi:steroid delta-isomerase [Mycobacterium sp. MS1601]|uniref:nuclear transport factor 2 family protein n=1 Tax=Mycobacterium sp. MS1601 TaxID=1936029 RepID=UPI0009797723|nr:nuclear transport factor 2 family protein [Mycobacterium sp. MS1601]AQA03971.1 steroid delta-isomerase [Mycobacterium sp. MS1601]